MSVGGVGVMLSNYILDFMDMSAMILAVTIWTAFVAAIPITIFIIKQILEEA